MRCIGTLGLLVKAKRRGLIVAVRPLLNELRTQGMFVSKELENETLKAADEFN
jgi:predicted nucleic acid-binding protein